MRSHATAEPPPEQERPATDATDSGVGTDCRPGTSRLFLGLAILPAALLSVGGVWKLADSLTGGRESFAVHTVTRGDLPLQITESGVLESQVQTEIRCEVADVQGDGINGHAIIWIVPNGTSVKKGDLLLQIDSASLEQLKIEDQLIRVERSRANKIQADAKYENRKSLNQTRSANAQLAVDLADLRLRMYQDGNSGTYRLERRKLEMAIQDAMGALAEARASLSIQSDNREAVDTLSELGYRGKGDIQQAAHSFLKAKDEVTTANSSLIKARAKLKKLEAYDHRISLRKLEAALETAKRNREQVERDNEALLTQALAVQVNAQRTFEADEMRLWYYRDQLAKCEIRAPHDGMAVYAVQPSWQPQIAEGAVVYRGQHLLSLPDLSAMQAKVTVHASALQMVHPDSPASIVVHAFADRVYHGTVDSVAVLPDQANWFTSDVKVYETIVKIEGNASDLKPGMSVSARIQTRPLHDVLTVPVEAVVQSAEDTWCYVEAPEGPVRRELSLGRSNEDLVEIRDGLQEGERIITAPSAIAGE